MAKAVAFEGFSRDLMRFFTELEKNNSKTWFDAHRADYEGLFVGPAKQFVAAMGTVLAKISKDIRADPRINGSIMRVNRDVRFSKDKRPYKASLHILFAEGGARQASPAFYFGLDAESAYLGGGLFGFRPEQMARYRAAAVDAKQGKALASVVAKVMAVPGMTLGGQHYKRVPRGFDADHANAELLKHAGLYAGVSAPPPPEVFGPGAIDHCLAGFKRVRPLQKWLVDAVGDG